MAPSTTESPPAQFRAGMLDLIQVKSDRLAEAASHLILADGKGIRPHCVRMIARIVGSEVLDTHERLAQAVELLHLGSLIHDDILDDADLRRGVPSVHSRWGTKVAVLAGDYLLSHASRLVGALGHPVIINRMGEVLADLCEGELLQDEQQRNLDVRLDDYLERIAKKTSGPFVLACEGAAILSSASETQYHAAHRFGFHLGRLFQMIDDLLDWSEAEAIANKPIGRDLLAGSLTLPVLVPLSHPDFGPQLQELLTPYPDALSDDVIAFLSKPEVAMLTLDRVREEITETRHWLRQLPSSESREEMEGYLDALRDQAMAYHPH